MQSAAAVDAAPHSNATAEIAPSKAEKRVDIQVLRGIAVLMVVAYHALPDVFEGGFLGVDVFFVISGFLITRHILQDLEVGRFRLSGFYMRRARRLLPAAWTTFLVTTVLAYGLLSSQEWRDYLAQLAGALTFTANIVLARQSGYFEAAADAKPLLHIWSLSLEEQFYFLTPVVLLLIPRRFRPAALLAGAMLSLSICLALVSDLIPIPIAKAAGKAAFYLLPGRAWELLAGGLTAWVMLWRPKLSPPAWLRWVALILVFGLCFRTFDSVHPRGDAILVVLATALILAGGDGWMRGVRAARPVAAVGDWSYSIYLIHWPLLAFAHASWLGQPPAVVAVTIAVASLPIGWLQYRWVEQPFQRRLLGRSGSTRVWLGVSLAAFAVACAPAVWANRGPARPSLPPNTGLNDKCNSLGGVWEDRSLCRTSPRPTVAIWGDSYAMHLVSGVQANAGPVGLVQMTKSSCAPVVGLAAVNRERPVTAARECEAFNDSVIKELETSRSIRVVVISSPWGQAFNPQARLLLGDHVSNWRPVGAERLIVTVKRLQAAGKTPVLVGPTPEADFNAGACNVRLREGLLIFGRRDCTIDQAESRRAQRRVISGLRQVARETGAALLLPEEALCRQGRCITAEGRVFIYRDSGHLSREGSALVVRRMGLDRLLTR